VHVVAVPDEVGLGLADPLADRLGEADGVSFELALALLLVRWTTVKVTIPARTSRITAPEAHCAARRALRCLLASRAWRRS